MDRRALFFLVAAAVAALLIPVCEAGYRWVPIFLTIVYTLLALASWADARTRDSIAAKEDAVTPAPREPV